MPGGPTGTELEGATCWPAIWVGEGADGCPGGGGGRSLGLVLTREVYPPNAGVGDGVEWVEANAKMKTKKTTYARMNRKNSPIET